MNILVTGCGDDIGQSVGKLLAEWKEVNTLIGLDITDRTCSKFIYPEFQVGPRVNSNNYLNVIETIVSERKIDFVIPLCEPEIRFYCERKLRKIGAAKVVVASQFAMEIGFSKLKTARILEEKSLPFPKTFWWNDFKGDFFPAVVKSDSGSGSKSLFFAENEKELALITGGNDMVVQQLVGTIDQEYTCGVFRSRKGEVRTIQFKRELLHGYSNYGEVVHIEKVDNLLRTLAEGIDLIGSINVQLRFVAEIPYVFEINPRFSSTVLFRHLMGYQDVIWSIQDLNGEELSDFVPVSKGIRFYKGFKEYIEG